MTGHFLQPWPKPKSVGQNDLLAALVALIVFAARLLSCPTEITQIVTCLNN